MNPKKAAAIALLVLLCANAFSAEIENNSMVQKVTARIIIEGEGVIAGSLSGTAAEIEVLSFRDSEQQKIVSLSETFEIGGKEIRAEAKEDEFGNMYAVFKTKSVGKFTYKIDALIETGAMLPDLQDFNLSGKITEFPQFLKPSQNIESNHEAIRTVALNTFTSSSWLETVAEATQWTYDNVEYDLDFFPETHSALSTLGTRKGVCDEFAVLEAAMLRAKGIPTRIASGLTFNPKESPGWNNHAWLEAYNPKSGWISLDPTFGEAGVVDGTHIKRGSFPDPAQASVSKVTAVQTATVSLEEKQATVKMQSFQKFGSTFSIEAEKIVMPANKWHELRTKVANEIGGNVISWLSLVLPANFESQKKKQIVLFGQNEEKEIFWRIKIDKELKKNEYLTGTYKVIALADEAEKGLKVLPGTDFKEEACLELENVIPIAKDGMLTLDIELENIGAADATAKIAVESIEQEMEVPGFESRTATISIESQEGKEYSVSISGPCIEYRTTIIVQEGQPMPLEQAQNQPRKTSANEPETWNPFSIETALTAAIIVGILAIVLLLKELLSK